MKPEEHHQLTRAQECRDSLDSFIGHPTSKHLREQFERRKAEYEKDYDEKFELILQKEKQKGWVR